MLFQKMKMEPQIKQEEDRYSYKLPQRPKNNLSGQGTQVKLLTNYFSIKVRPFDQIYIFKIAFEPKIMHDNRQERERILDMALPSIKQQITKPVIGGMNIYTVEKPTCKEKEYNIQGYKILIKQVKCIDVRTNPKLFILFLNNGIRNIMSSKNYLQIGQTGKYFSKDICTKLKNVHLYSGFKVNFLLAEGGLFLRVDPAFKVVQNSTVLQFINKIYEINKMKARDQKRMQVKQALIGKTVMTNYGKTRYVKIEDIEFVDSLETMLIPGKQNLNILDYYNKKYQIKIECRKQPLLKIQNKNKRDFNIIYMLPQLCLMTGYPQYDFDQSMRKRIHDSTIVNPNKKFETITDFVKKLLIHQQANRLTEIGIQISNQPHQVKAKKLDAPSLRLGQNNRIQKGKQEFFQLYDKPVYDNRKNFQIIAALIYYSEQGLNQMCQTFERTCKNLRVRLKLFKYRVKSKKFQKDQFKSILQSTKKDKCNFCLTVLQNNMTNCYSQIKEICLKEFKVMSQVVISKTLKKPMQAIHTKILLQILVKSGFTLWCPTVSKNMDSVMIASLDFKKHPSGRQKKAKIIGIASINKEKTQFSSHTQDIQQICDKYTKMVKILFNMLVKYQKKNQQLPSQILVLTDSCPNNQIKMYQDHFVPLFYNQIKQIGGSASQLKLTIIQTRDISSQRFFQSSYGGKDIQMNNPPSGLIISSQIVSQNYDFYLVSQKPRNGCTVPINFNVINTNSQLSEDLIHQLMYSQCFNYANFTGSIKVPSIMQYAKKLARFSTSVFKEQNVSSSEICDRLYFI